MVAGPGGCPVTAGESMGCLLIVDDEASVREVLSEYFVGQGYQVETAASGPQALDAVRRHRPDLVLLDVRMPGLDGVEVLRRLRELDARLPVVMVTANEDVALARSMLGIGAFDYVAKPFDFHYLDRVVAAALVQAGGGTGGGRAPEAASPWRRLVVQAFRVARDMSPAARASTGARLEEAALEAAREAGQSRPGEAAAWLDRIALLLAVATELGDVPAEAGGRLETAVEEARKALSVA